MEIGGRKRRRSEPGLSNKPTAEQLTVNGLRTTYNQLIDLWRYDNECGRKYMRGCPLRSCTVDGDMTSVKDSTDTIGLTIQEMNLVKSSIQEMWQQAGGLFEIFMVKGEENEGYRLRVKKDLAVKVVIRQQDAVAFGWIAQIPEQSSSAHIFKRSSVDPNGYLGGPISYMNWCPTSKQQVSVLKSISPIARHICKMWTNRHLVPGTELRWDYGCNQYMPDGGEWFKDECCRVSNVHPSNEKRHAQNDVCRNFFFRELCVLCGYAYSINNKDNRSQRKQHFAGVHADFLGSQWDGSNCYKQEVVDPDTLFMKADELNYLLSALNKMNWNVLPACKVFTEEELASLKDEDELMSEFERRFEMFKRGGTLVLRGTEVPSLPHHFKAIQPRTWKVITWKDGVKPPSGRYAVTFCKTAHELRLPEFLSIFCEKYLK